MTPNQTDPDSTQAPAAEAPAHESIVQRAEAAAADGAHIAIEAVVSAAQVAVTDAMATVRKVMEMVHENTLHIPDLSRAVVAQAAALEAHAASLADLRSTLGL